MQIILTGEEEALKRIKRIGELFKEIENEIYELHGLRTGLVRLDPDIESNSEDGEKE